MARHVALFLWPNDFCADRIALFLAPAHSPSRTARPPYLPADVPAPQRLAAKATVVALYMLLAVQPLLGLAASMLQGDHILVFSRILVPSFLPINRPLARLIFTMHGWAALLLLALIGVHVAAALYHHFIRRDDVLSGMLPELRRSARPDMSEPEEVPG